MHKELSEAPLSHLLSTYVIRPVVFDYNPYIIPKSAPYNKKKTFNKHHDPNTNQSFKKGGNLKEGEEAPAATTEAAPSLQKNTVN